MEIAAPCFHFYPYPPGEEGLALQGHDLEGLSQHRQFLRLPDPGSRQHRHSGIRQAIPEQRGGHGDSLCDLEKGQMFEDLRGGFHLPGQGLRRIRQGLRRSVVYPGGALWHGDHGVSLHLSVRHGGEPRGLWLQVSPGYHLRARRQGSQVHLQGWAGQGRTRHLRSRGHEE